MPGWRFVRFTCNVFEKKACMNILWSPRLILFSGVLGHQDILSDQAWGWSVEARWEGSPLRTQDVCRRKNAQFGGVPEQFSPRINRRRRRRRRKKHSAGAIPRKLAATDANTKTNFQAKFYTRQTKITFRGTTKVVYMGPAKLVYMGHTKFVYMGATKFVYMGHTKLVYMGHTKLVYMGHTKLDSCRRTRKFQPSSCISKPCSRRSPPSSQPSRRCQPCSKIKSARVSWEEWEKEKERWQEQRLVLFQVWQRPRHAVSEIPSRAEKMLLLRSLGMKVTQKK